MLLGCDTLLDHIIEGFNPEQLILLLASQGDVDEERPIWNEEIPYALGAKSQLADIVIAEAAVAHQVALLVEIWHGRDADVQHLVLRCHDAVKGGTIDHETAIRSIVFMGMHFDYSLFVE